MIVNTSPLFRSLLAVGVLLLRFGFGQGCALLAQRVARQFDSVSAARQPVEQRVGHRRIAQVVVPGADWQLAGDQR